MVLSLARAIRIPMLVILALVVLFAVRDRASAAAQTSTASGDWTSTATWVSGTVPAAGDTVTIASGHTVTVSTTATIEGVTVDGGGTLVVTGSLSVGASNLAVAGTVTNNGTLSVTGTLTGAGTLTQGTSATLNLGNPAAPTITTLDTTNLPNTVNYNFAGDQAIKVNTYSNLTLSGSGTKTGALVANAVSGALTLAGTAAFTTVTNMVVGGALNVQGGALTIPNTLTVSGNTTLSGGTLTITDNAGTKTFTGDITVNGGTWDNDDVVETVAVGGNITFISGTFNSGTGLYTLNGASKTITGPITIDALTLAAPGSLSISGAVTIGTLTVNTTTSVTNNGTLTVTTSLAGAGTLINGANRTINIQATGAPAAGLTFDMTSNTPNTVNYSRNDGANQALKGTATYHHLVLSGSGAKTGATLITVNGDFTLSGSATWTPGTAVVTFLGNFLNNSDQATPVTAAAGTNLTFDTPSPAAATSIGGSSANTLALTVLNFNNTSGVSTSKTITSTTVGVGGSATFTNSGTLTSTASTVSGGATLTNNGTMTSTTLTVNGTFTNPSAGTHTVSGTFTVASGGLYTNNGTTTAAGTLIGAGSLVAGTNSTLNLNNAAAPTITTLTLSTNTPNTVTYGGAAQTIRAGSYSHLTLQNSGIKTAAGPLTVSGTFTLTGTAAFTAGAHTHTFSGDWVHDTAVATPLVATGSTIVFATPSPAAARSISGSAGTTLAFETITVSNTSGLTLSKPITATGLVTVSGSLTVAAAATVTISGSGALTVENGATLSNAGTVTITGTGTITVGSGSAATFTNTGTVTTPGLLDGSGSFLNNANATLNITGSAAPSVTTFNLTGSTPNTVNYTMAGAQTVRAGTYHHLTLGTSGTKTAGGSITVNGTLTLSGTASFATTATTHHIKGNWVHGASATVAAAGGSVVSFEGASATISGAASVPLAFAGVAITSGASVTSLINLSASGTFTVHSGGTLTLDSGVVVSGGGTFTLASGGTLAIQSPLGITSSGASGNVQTTTRTFDTGGNYTYNSSAGAQVTGSGLPATVNNLTLSNTSGVTLTSSVTVTGALTFTTGTVTPVISGTTTSGQTLSTTNGTWLNAPTFTYQWQRCKPGCTNIAGATATTYVLTADDVDATIRVNVTGTYTAAFTVSSAQTATIAAIGGATPTPTPAPSGGGGNGGAPAPTPTPTPTPTGPTVEDEPGIGSITLATGGASVETLSGSTQVVVSATAAGSDVTVSVPAGALGTGGEIVVGFAADLPGLVQTAAPPTGARILAGLVVQATAANGTAITSNFAQPVTLQVTIPAADIPPGSTAARLAFTFWNGSEWVVTPATIVVNLDGSVTVTALLTHFTVFALFRQPDVAWTGTFPAAGVVLAIWQGLTGTEPLAAASLKASPVTAIWRMDVVAQRFLSWVLGAPAFVNRIPTLRSGEPLILRIGDTPPPTAPAPTPAATSAPTPSGGTSSAAVRYTVTSTDTLAAIGARFGIPWPTIAAANDIAGPDYFIHTGQVLTIPGATPTTASVPPAPSPTAPTTPPPSTNRTHVVLSTDTLSGIGALYSVPWLTIAVANDIPGPNYFIRTGQVLTIPSAGSTPSGSSTSAAPTATPSAPATSGAARTHVVLSTDTLSGIGALYNVPWLTIAAANGIEGPNYVISTGQVLTIPSTASPAAPAGGAGTQTVVVGDGETLSQIGERLGVPWLEIAEANGITGPLHIVRSGQVLVIPAR